jgi:sugar lactone lactonase YvrE
MIDEFEAKGQLDRTPLDVILEREGLVDSPLLFPGKILADEVNGRLFIADSNHNRIVVAAWDGVVLDVIGSGVAGWQDGDFMTAAFFHPQGLTLADDNTLYVADTENHALRRVDLAARLVTTVAGTGEQGRYQQFEGNGLEVALNSPWDVWAHEGLVYIAMAGQHQLWVYEPATEIVRAFAGSGREELKDGLLLEGGLNQPSGLATDGRRLFFADSEASAIRYGDLAEGTLHTIVGTGLFDFGDVDGVGEVVPF